MFKKVTGKKESHRLKPSWLTSSIFKQNLKIEVVPIFQAKDVNILYQDHMFVYFCVSCILKNCWVNKNGNRNLKKYVHSKILWIKSEWDIRFMVNQLLILETTMLISKTLIKTQQISSWIPLVARLGESIIKRRQLWLYSVCLDLVVFLQRKTRLWTWSERMDALEGEMVRVTKSHSLSILLFLIPSNTFLVLIG